MSFPVYGEIMEKEGFPEYGEIIPDPSRPQSLFSAPIKGAIKGAEDLGNVNPLGAVGPIPSALGKRILNFILPTQEKIPEKILERSARAVPAIIGGGGSIVAKSIRSILSGTAGQAAEELGAPEWGQKIAEIAALSGPNLSAKIPLKKAQENLFNFARRKGFTEKEIAPLLQDKKALNRWASLAYKGEKTQQLMHSIYEKTGKGFQEISQSAKKLPPLTEEGINEFLSDIQGVIENVRPRFRRLIQNDLNDLLNSQMGFNDLKDFYQDINSTVRGVEGGRAVLNLFKGPVMKGLEKISPELTSDYSLMNQLYSARANVAKKLTPNQVEDLLSMGEKIGLLAGIGQGDLGILKTFLGAVGGRSLAREMLINPRLQNLSQRILESLKKNNIHSAVKIGDIFKTEMKKSGIFNDKEDVLSKKQR